MSELKGVSVLHILFILLIPSKFISSHKQESGPDEHDERPGIGLMNTKR
jgi:hypothetical protein